MNLILEQTCLRLHGRKVQKNFSHFFFPKPTDSGDRNGRREQAGKAMDGAVGTKKCEFSGNFFFFLYPRFLFFYFLPSPSTVGGERISTWTAKREDHSALLKGPDLTGRVNGAWRLKRPARE